MGRNAERAGPKLERAANAARNQAQGMAQQAKSVAAQARTAGGNGSWVERSDIDRRRVERPGIRDRRTGGDSAG
jgi:hypothetical protein